MKPEKRKFNSDLKEEILDSVSKNIDFVTVYKLIKRTKLYRDFQEKFKTLKNIGMNYEKIKVILEQIIRGEEFDDFLNLLLFTGQDIAAKILFPNLEDLCDLKNKDPKYEHSDYFSFGDHHPDDSLKQNDNCPSLSNAFSMLKSPRGYCYLVNNLFTIGTYKEIQRFRNIFFQFHFDVEMDKNLNFKQIEDRIKNLIDISKSRGDQAFVFMFLGFGNENRDLIDFEGNVESIDRFIERYDEKLLDLKNFPKLFFFNCCFINTEENIVSQSITNSNSKGLSENQWMNESEDFVTCYSRFQIKSDEFDINNGTEFGNELANLLIETSWYKDLQKILHSAKSHLKKSGRNNQKYKAFVTESNYFRDREKYLYFFPNLPKPRLIIRTKYYKDISFFSSEDYSNETPISGTMKLYNYLFMSHKLFILYRGFFGDPPRKAIIRKYAKFNENIFEKDKKFLSSLEDENSQFILKYYDQVKIGDECYIAHELPERSLETFILKDLNPLIKKVVLIEYIQQITEGLKFLENKKIFSANINPENIFLTIPDRNNCTRVKISNFCFDGLECDDLLKSLSWISYKAVTKLQNNEKFIANAKDYVFSLGCVSYFMISRGQYLFKKGLERLFDNKNPEFLFPVENPTDLNFLERMIEPIEDFRFSIDDVLKHPFFWKSSEKLKFFVEVKNNVVLGKKIYNNPASSPNKKDACLNLENKKIQLFNNNWMFKLPRKIKLYEQRRPSHIVSKSDQESVKGLIKYIRDKSTHWEEYDDYVKNLFGSTKENFIELILEPLHFPNLLIITYDCMRRLKKECNLDSYYA